MHCTALVVFSDPYFDRRYDKTNFHCPSICRSTHADATASKRRTIAAYFVVVNDGLDSMSNLYAKLKGQLEAAKSRHGFGTCVFS